MSYIPGTFLLIDKPQGMTSFDVIWRLRKKLGIKKMGHAGTLDPRATGLLIIALEKDTKKIKELIGLPKVYEAQIVLGIKTDTGDLDGKIIEQKDVSHIFSSGSEKELKKQIEDILKEMKGELVLPVPLYSAIKKNGKRLYRYALEGKEVELPKKTMNIYDVALKNISKENCMLTIEFHVSSGTYIRSIAEELGKKFGTVATLKELRRTSIGEYHVNDAEPKEILEKAQP